MAPEPSPARAFAAPLRRRSATARVSRFPLHLRGHGVRLPATRPPLLHRSTNACMGSPFMCSATLLPRLTVGFTGSGGAGNVPTPTRMIAGKSRPIRERRSRCPVQTVLGGVYSYDSFVSRRNYLVVTSIDQFPSASITNIKPPLLVGRLFGMIMIPV